MSVIEQFINRYVRECDYYREAARICARQCEIILEKNGIRANVTYRTKRPDRLRQKIEKRNRRKHYETIEEISRDIIDLAGVRIALCFPHDRDQVNRLIQHRFDCEEVKILPDRKMDSSLCQRFTGYRATHYRVGLRPETLPASNARYALARIEVQVASVLVFAWAEVEHDLRYKQFQGAISRREHLILDELAGVVLAGEHALERLHRITTDRSNGGAITNHFEMAAFLHKEIHHANHPGARTVVMGRADVLFHFLQLTGAAPESLVPMIQGLDLDRPIVRQLVDGILMGAADKYWLFLQAKRDVEGRKACGCVHLMPQSNTEQQAIRFFLSQWAAFERIMAHFSERDQPARTLPDDHEQPRDQMPLPIEIHDDATHIRNLRDDLMYGSALPAIEFLVEAAKSLQAILGELQTLVPEETWQVTQDGMIESGLSAGEASAADLEPLMGRVTTIPVMEQPYTSTCRDNRARRPQSTQRAD